jgi:sodium-dependent dicarboxylate transporter 2/3/5
MIEINNELDRRKKRLRSFYCFTGSLIVALALTWLVKEPSFTDSQVYVFFLLFFSVGLWLTEAIPAFAVALFVMAYLVFTLGNPLFNSAPEKIDRYVHTFSSSIIWLMIGGFFLAAAMTKTKLDERLLRFTLKISGTKPGNVVIAFMFTTMIGSMIMSNTAITAMLIAALMPLLNKLGRSGLSKALLLGISIAATTGGMGTIIGTPPNAVAAGMLEDEGIKIDFLHWMLYGIPVAVVLTAISGFVLLKLFVKNSAPVAFDSLEKGKNDTRRESKIERNIVIVVIIVTVLLWLTSSLHGISSAAISAIPIVVLTLTGVITGDDVRTLPWDTLFLVAGGLSLGEALESTKILEHYANHMRGLNMNIVVVIFILAYASMIFSNIMSNAATCTVLIPVAFAIFPAFEKQLALSIGLAASAALFLPVATPPNSIVYSTGLLDQKDFRIGGFLIGILGPLLAVLWVLLISGM